MGTRNLTAVYVDGEYKVAQYGQWDGYPSVSGADVVSTMREVVTTGNLERFKENVRGCRFITDEEMRGKNESVGIDPDARWIDLQDASRFKDAYPQLDRDMGSSVLSYIFKYGPQELNDELNFVTDPLFCEWAYVVDLDDETIEVYVGISGNAEAGSRFEGMGDEYVTYLDRITFDEMASLTTDEIVERWEGKSSQRFD